MDLAMARLTKSFVSPILIGIISGNAECKFPFVLFHKHDFHLFPGSAGGFFMQVEKRLFGQDGGSNTLYCKTKPI